MDTALTFTDAAKIRADVDYVAGPDHTPFVNIKPHALQTESGRFKVTGIHDLGDGLPLFKVYYEVDSMPREMALRLDGDKGFLEVDIENDGLPEDLRPQIRELAPEIISLISHVRKEITDNVRQRALIPQP